MKTKEFTIELLDGPLAGQQHTIMLRLEQARIGERWTVGVQKCETPGPKGWPWDSVKVRIHVYEFVQIHGMKLVATYRGLHPI